MFIKRSLALMVLISGVLYQNSFADADNALANDSSIVRLNSDNFDAEITNNDGLAVVLFFANWCGHCKNLKPKFIQMAQNSGSIKFGAVDVDKEGDLTQEYEVSGFPTVIIFKDGKEVDKLVGATQDSITQSIQKNS